MLSEFLNQSLDLFLLFSRVTFLSVELLVCLLVPLNQDTIQLPILINLGPHQVKLILSFLTHGSFLADLKLQPTLLLPQFLDQLFMRIPLNHIKLFFFLISSDELGHFFLILDGLVLLHLLVLLGQSLTHIVHFPFSSHMLLLQLRVALLKLLNTLLHRFPFFSQLMTLVLLIVVSHC